MADGGQSTVGHSSASGPRFRIVPGPLLGENTRSSASRNATLSSSASTPSFSATRAITQDELNSNNAQQMMTGTPMRQSVQPVQQVQYVIMSQGGIPASTTQQAMPPQQQPQTQRPLQQHMSSTPSAEETQSMVSKCARFFKTLIHLSQQPEQQQGQQTALRVTDLVNQVIYGTMQPEVFTCRLQEALRSQAQPHLLTFLQKTLPSLRAALKKGEVTIDGISPPAPLPQPQQPQQSQPAKNVINQTSEVQQLQQWDTNSQRNTTQTTYQVATASNGPQIVVASAQPVNVVKQEISEELPQAEGSEQLGSENEVRILSANQVRNRLLNGDVLAKKIQRVLPECGPPLDEVLTLISEAAEHRLRGILAQLAVITEHRLEPLRNHPCYQAIDDTRRQLKFVEELDRQEHEKRENREKEALIRLSKSKGKDKDTLVEKAKQLQRADQEAARNRDANAAAIAALGGTRIKKRTWADSNNPLDQNISFGLSAPVQRPRTKRVTMRDLHMVLISDPVARFSTLRHRLALFNTPSDTAPV
uniref:TAFH domain-containing protein n=1 Tax=Syphacia muris TaxID=451379 RepID=A0A0N5AX75_9BILA